MNMEPSSIEEGGDALPTPVPVRLKIKLRRPSIDSNFVVDKSDGDEIVDVNTIDNNNGNGDDHDPLPELRPLVIDEGPTAETPASQPVRATVGGTPLSRPPQPQIPPQPVQQPQVGAEPPRQRPRQRKQQQRTIAPACEQMVR